MDPASNAVRSHHVAFVGIGGVGIAVACLVLPILACGTSAWPFALGAGATVECLTLVAVVALGSCARRGALPAALVVLAHVAVLGGLAALAVAALFQGANVYG